MHIRTLPLLLAIVGTDLFAGDVHVVDATAQATGGGSFNISVTLEHGDSGWDHYADRWDVVTADGVLLGTRTLFHPHVNEQPFTRSLGGITIPAGITRVLIRAHDSVHGYATAVFPLELPH